jgi:hypothetical protein
MLLGFDISTAPSPVQLTQLREHFDFCGCYLAPAPSHQDRSWMVAGIANARHLGFRFLPIFVGQQVVGPGSHNDTAAQGQQDAFKAAQLMHAAGFALNAPVYLDLENGAPFPPAESAYAFAWIEHIRGLGFTPGVYCSHVLAPHFNPDKSRVWAFQVPTTALTKQAKLPPPAPASLNGHSAMQYRQNVMLDGISLTVDLDAADSLALAG